MSLTSRRNGTGRVYVRSFDHEEAAARYANGERVADLVAEYGVTKSGVYNVLTVEAKSKSVANNRRWRSGRCDKCGGPAMRLVGSKKQHNKDGRSLCLRCRNIERRERLRFDNTGRLVSVRCSTIDCAHGERWQPPVNFARGTKFRDVREGGIHGQCRDCLTRAKRRSRAAHPEYRRANGGSASRSLTTSRGRYPEDVQTTRSAE